MAGWTLESPPPTHECVCHARSDWLCVRSIRIVIQIDLHMIDAEAAGYALLKSFESGEETVGSMKQRLTRLEEENSDLRLRVGHGRQTVERMLARIDFLEVQK